MNFVIPMAGAGSRFTEAGYSDPKPLLQARGKTLLEWSVDSLPLELSTNLIFVGLRKDQRLLERLIKARYSDYGPQFVWLDEGTRGQSETVLAATQRMDYQAPLLIFNIDTTFRSKTLAKSLSLPGYDGVIGCFSASAPRFSYAKTDLDGVVVEVREKEVISPHALTGLYHFARARDFLRVAQDAVDADEREKGEFYVAPLYNRLIDEGQRYILDEVDYMSVLGTPAEYEKFCETSDRGSN